MSESGVRIELIAIQIKSKNQQCQIIWTGWVDFSMKWVDCYLAHGECKQWIRFSFQIHSYTSKLTNYQQQIVPNPLKSVNPLVPCECNTFHRIIQTEKSKWNGKFCSHFVHHFIFCLHLKKENQPTDTWHIDFSTRTLTAGGRYSVHVPYQMRQNIFAPFTFALRFFLSSIEFGHRRHNHFQCHKQYATKNKHKINRKRREREKMKNENKSLARIFPFFWCV